MHDREVDRERDGAGRDPRVGHPCGAQAGLDRSGRRSHRRAVLSAASSSRSARRRTPAARSPTSDVVWLVSAVRTAGLEAICSTARSSSGLFEQMVGHLGGEPAVQSLLDEQSRPLLLERGDDSRLDVGGREHRPGDALQHAMLRQRAGQLIDVRRRKKLISRRREAGLDSKSTLPALGCKASRGAWHQHRSRGEARRQDHHAPAHDRRAHAEHDQPHRDVTCGGRRRPSSGLAVSRRCGLPLHDDDRPARGSASLPCAGVTQRHPAWVTRRSPKRGEGRSPARRRS